MAQGAPASRSSRGTLKAMRSSLVAIGGGIADVFLFGAEDVGKALPEDGDDGGRIIDGKGGLRDVGEALGVTRSEAVRVGCRLDQHGCAGRQLTQGANHFRVAGV